MTLRDFTRDLIAASALSLFVLAVSFWLPVTAEALQAVAR